MNEERNKKNTHLGRRWRVAKTGIPNFFYFTEHRRIAAVSREEAELALKKKRETKRKVNVDLDQTDNMLQSNVYLTDLWTQTTWPQ